MTHKILIVGPAWVGDMVMAQTLFRLIKHHHPKSVLHVLAPDWTRALLSRMPEVSQAHSMPLGHGQLLLKARWRLGRALAKEQFTQAIVLPNSWKSALIPFFAGIKQRTGWRGECRYGLLNDIRVLDKQQYPLMIERFMALGLPKNTALEKPYLLPRLIIDAAQLPALLDRYGLHRDKPIIGLCPGAAFGSSKRWPPDYFAEVAKVQLAKGYQIWLFGSKEDQPLAAKIQTDTHQACIDLTGKTSLAEAIDLMSCVESFVTNDSGTMHIAGALDKPLIAVYGSTSADFTPPLGDKATILNLHLSCSPCFKRVCPLGHHKCMIDLHPEKVITLLDK